MPAPPRYQPFDGRAFRLRMGLRSLPRGGWLEPDDHFDADLAQKARLLDERHDEVVALAPDPSGAASAACHQLVDLISQESGRPRVADHAHPIEVAGRLTQEDWCVHLPDDSGRWRLVAACVCFPTRWVLADKIGRTVREIHAPVAFYDEQLADPVDAFFDRLRLGIEHGVWRLNWNLLDDPALFQPVRKGGPDAPTAVRAADAGDSIWFRVERQTLVKLPESEAVVFGIRVHVDPLGSLGSDPEVLERLERSLRAMPREAWEYKGLRAYGDEVLAWITAQH